MMNSNRNGFQMNGRIERIDNNVHAMRWIIFQNSSVPSSLLRVGSSSNVTEEDEDEDDHHSSSSTNITTKKPCQPPTRREDCRHAIDFNLGDQEHSSPRSNHATEILRNDEEEGRESIVEAGKLCLFRNFSSF